jgi:LDH2 family malate/lactate/ureidoglycolate dehydrogenase
MPTLTSSQLTDLSKSLLKAAGASEEEASIVSRYLVKSNLAGVDSHGISNLTSYIKGLRRGVIKAGAKLEITRETECTALVDGKWGFGQVVCTKAMNIAIEKAKKTGVGAVGIFNCNHIGRLADYTQMAIEHGMIGFVAANSDPNVAPHGGKKPILSTNPLSYGVPAGVQEPIVVDFATSAAAEGKIRAFLHRGEQLPPGWILDSEGRPSTNPADLYEPPLPPAQIKMAGTLLPAGGHKGYGLSLAVDALAGALTGTGIDGEITSGLTNGVFIIVLKIDEFVPLEKFKASIDRLIRAVKNSPKAPGFDEILIPGELESREENKRSKTGIPVPETTWNDLVATCKEYGLDAEKLIRM